MKAIFLFVLFSISFLFIEGTETVKPLWKDPRALYKAGRIEIIKEAFEELTSLELIDKSFWDSSIDEFYYIHENNDCKKDEADAIYKHVYRPDLS